MPSAGAFSKGPGKPVLTKAQKTLARNVPVCASSYRTLRIAPGVARELRKHVAILEREIAELASNDAGVNFATHRNVRCRETGEERTPNNSFGTPQLGRSLTIGELALCETRTKSRHRPSDRSASSYAHRGERQRRRPPTSGRHSPIGSRHPLGR
jgi:hypothetical protein